MSSTRSSRSPVGAAVALLLAVLLPAALLPGPAAKKKDRPTGSRIYGKVQSDDGKTGVAGVVLHAYHLASDAKFRSEPTSGKGEFVLEGLPFGYYDLVAETPEGAFVASTVVSVPPSGKALVLLTLKRYDDQPPTWWQANERRAIPGSDEAATGVAQVVRKLRGIEFWKSPRGVLIVAGSGAAVLLALAADSDSTNELVVSPSNP